MEFVRKIKNYPGLGLILLAYVAFIALGMPDGLLGVAWPSIRSTFSIPLDALGMLVFAGTAGYMTSGFLSGPLISRLGVGRVLAGSCTVTGMVLIGYTLVPSWWMMVTLGVVIGLGAGAIDAGLNTYVAAHFGEGVMQWLHASYGVGITLGPIIMTFALAQWSSWRLGYITVGGFQLLLAACFVLTLPMWGQKDASAGADKPRRLTDYRTPLGETLRRPRVWLSAALFFVYVGCEVGLGTWAYTLLTEFARHRRPGRRAVDRQLLGGLHRGAHHCRAVCQAGGCGCAHAGQPAGRHPGLAALVVEPGPGSQPGCGRPGRLCHRAGFPRPDVGHQPAGGGAGCRQHHRLADGRFRPGRRQHLVPGGRAGAAHLAGGYSGLPGGLVPGALRIVQAGQCWSAPGAGMTGKVRANHSG